MTSMTPRYERFLGLGLLLGALTGACAGARSEDAPALAGDATLGMSSISSSPIRSRRDRGLDLVQETGALVGGAYACALTAAGVAATVGCGVAAAKSAGKDWSCK
jgi:hypothetical protein